MLSRVQMIPISKNGVTPPNRTGGRTKVATSDSIVVGGAGGVGAGVVYVRVWVDVDVDAGGSECGCGCGCG